MDWATRARVLNIVTLCAWAGAAAGLAVAYYNDWWTLIWGAAGASLPPGRYPRILLLVLGILYLALPLAIGAALGAAAGALLGYAAAMLLITPRRN